MKRWILIGLYVCFLVPFLCGMGFGGYVLTGVFGGDPKELDRDRIVAILSKESVVYYADGKTQLGSLFGDVHRQYVPLNSIPQHVLDAVVAAEDDGFYKHHGVDPVSTLRAAFRTLVQQKQEGASTITQQTVKNLFGRKRVDIFMKIEEAINAFRLEKRYSKREILEFYLNQFHVAGNGRGIGIAARHYFNKDVSELTLTESAFIAGSVKAPSRYNPFIKKTEEEVAKARAAAKNRKNYVLRRMLELGFIKQAEFDGAAKQEVPFKQGRFQFNELSLVDLVQRQLARPEILKAVGVDNVREMQSMGLHITTTIDRDVQTGAQYAVRQNLSRLQMIMEGFKKEPEADHQPVLSLENGEFYVGRVAAVAREPGKESLKVGFGAGVSCTVPPDGIERVAKILDTGRWIGPDKARKKLMEQLVEGDEVFVSVRPDSKPPLCDLETRPAVEGGLVVLDRGRIVALVGGFQTFGYNRAFFARRQPGSTFKTLTYYPALQLGWSPLDMLSNLRTVHKWQGQYYFPRPDHEPYPAETNFVEAAAKSENLASIWLLHHLTERLTASQFADVMRFADLWKEEESEEAFVRRMRARFGLSFDNESVREGVFDRAKDELLMDLTIGTDANLMALVRMMQYGLGFSDEADRLREEFQARKAQAGKEDDPNSLTPEEYEARIHILKNNFLRWRALAQESRQAFTALQEALLDATANPSVLVERARKFAILPSGEIAYLSDARFLPAKVSPLLPDPAFRTDNPIEVSDEIQKQLDRVDPANIVLDGVLPAQFVERIEEEIAWRARDAMEGSPLDMLFSQADFRYSVGMLYAKKMCEQFGFQSEIAAVPSYPLGANVVTLTELAKAYQVIPTGQTYSFFKSESPNETLLVQRIEDAFGNLIWEASETAHEVVSDFFSSGMLGMLRGTVLAGTGREADRGIVLRALKPADESQLKRAQLHYPTFGKTGTTNEYVNATFVGYLPYPDPYSKSLNPRNMYTIAAYVGYDDNKPMKRPGFRVTGGTGALEAWIGTAQHIVKVKDFASQLDWRHLVQMSADRVPFEYGEGLEKVSIPVRRLDRPDNPNDTTPANMWSIGVENYLAGRFDGAVFLPARKVSLARDLQRELKEKAALAAEGAAPSEENPEDAGTEGKTGGLTP